MLKHLSAVRVSVSKLENEIFQNKMKAFYISEIRKKIKGLVPCINIIDLF